MPKTYDGREVDLGIQLYRRQSRRNTAKTITDLDIAKYIAVITEDICEGREVLTRLEHEVDVIGRKKNTKKSELQIFNQSTQIKMKDMC